jgi:DnaJ-class molecular chaperone
VLAADPQFKQIAVAYQVLSDPELRHKYNEFGQKNGGAEDQLHDPEEVFGKMFGGDRFEELIGDISIGALHVVFHVRPADQQART